MPKFTFTPVPLEAAPSSSSSLEVEPQTGTLPMSS
ncbi:hypothetical protein M5D96_014029 [Drosophila gunungcola]|uniref:Uncharacterized protein n=1 Tax=Drosophila gunungcola TaxID=103775 RepID=A0A9Q0BHT3_9MUSC|nr:hypothetical protein M5D96_014029 [Drosophila gunungcola]